MNLSTILAELKEQALYLDQAITALVRLNGGKVASVRSAGIVEKRRRGRPLGAKNKQKNESMSNAA